MKERANKYITNVEPRLKEVTEWARDGLIDADIAHNLGIAYSTFREYTKKHKALSAALKEGKKVVDLKVENALLKKALGYVEVVEKTKVLGNGEVVSYLDNIYYQPDTTSIIFWLKNRKPEQWNDRKITEVTGADGGAIEIDTGAVREKLIEKLSKVN